MHVWSGLDIAGFGSSLLNLHLFQNRLKLLNADGLDDILLPILIKFTKFLVEITNDGFIDFPTVVQNVYNDALLKEWIGSQSTSEDELHQNLNLILRFCAKG